MPTLETGPVDDPFHEPGFFPDGKGTAAGVSGTTPAVSIPSAALPCSGNVAGAGPIARIDAPRGCAAPDFVHAAATQLVAARLTLPAVMLAAGLAKLGCFLRRHAAA